MKKTLAILLALALVICMLPSAAFATPTLSADEKVTSATIADIPSQEYTGNAITPTLAVTAVISSGTDVTRTDILTTGDYTVEYSDNTAVGNTAKAKITVNASLASQTSVTAEKTFAITARDLSNVNVTGIPAAMDSNKNNADLASELESKVGYTDKTGKVLNIASEIDITVSDNGTNNKLATFKAKMGRSNVTGQTSYNFPVGKDLSGYTLYTNASSSVYTGKAITFSGTYLRNSTGDTIQQNSGKYTLVYSDNVRAGEATVYAKAVSGSGYFGETSTTKFTIQSRPISGAGSQIQISSIGNVIYTGNPLTPSVTVTEKIDSTVRKLSEGTDFDVTYSNNTGSNTVSTTATATVNFKKDYSGSSNPIYFQIIPPTNNIANASVTVSNNKVQYTRGTLKPTIVVRDKNNNLLYEGTHYTVSYTKGATSVSNPTDVGLYSINIEGKGAYGGLYYAGIFEITQANIIDSNVTISGMSSSYAYSGTAVKPTFTVYYRSNRLYENTDYTVSYGSNNTTGTYAGTITLEGKGNFTGSRSIRFAITGKSIANCTAYFTDSRSSSSYTGSAVYPSITVRDGYTTLTKGIDYNVIYKDAAGKAVSVLREAGTYSIVIEGKGNYSGTTTLAYTIVGNDISRYTVTLKENQVAADGYYKTPVITSVAYGTTSRLLSSDYTVSYQDSTGKTVTYMSAPGVYKVVVTGKNGYSGSAYATFTIKGLDQTVKASEDSYKVYTTTETFRLYATATGDGTGFTYTSSNPAVASVSALGYVTMHKMGRAVITISTTGTKKYDPASDTVVIKVYPKKAVVTNKPWTDGKKSQFKVRWTKQQDATRYEVRYSRNKSFRSGTYITKKVTPSTLAYTTQSTTVKGLKSGYTYYVKVRAVKEVYNDYGQKLTYYGAWSGWRSIRTK